MNVNYQTITFKRIQNLSRIQSEISDILETIEYEIEELKNLYDEIDYKLEDFIDSNQELLNNSLTEIQE